VEGGGGDVSKGKPSRKELKSSWEGVENGWSFPPSSEDEFGVRRPGNGSAHLKGMFDRG